MDGNHIQPLLNEAQRRTGLNFSYLNDQLNNLYPLVAPFATPLNDRGQATARDLPYQTFTFQYVLNNWRTLHTLASWFDRLIPTNDPLGQVKRDPELVQLLYESKTPLSLLGLSEEYQERNDQLLVRRKPLLITLDANPEFIVAWENQHTWHGVEILHTTRKIQKEAYDRLSSPPAEAVARARTRTLGTPQL